MPYAHNGDVELYYETFGNPSDSALLLVNGLGGQCINFDEQWCKKHVTEGFFVIRFDNRDVGLSTKFSHVKPHLAAIVQARAEGREPSPPYTVHDMANDAVAVLDAAGVARAHVMGFSMGGMIVQTMAIDHPDRLLSMTSVMSTTGDVDAGASTPEARELLLAPPPTDRESYIERHLAGIRTWGSPKEYDEERLRAFAAAAFDRCFDPAGQGRQIMAVFAGSSRTDELRDVRVPTLVLHGSEDKLVDASGGRRTAEAIPGAQFVLIEGMGHDYPPAYWDQIVGLVTEHARGALRGSS
jgi:pimeloyl-ACP methyl ester carboxylesterase